MTGRDDSVGALRLSYFGDSITFGLGHDSLGVAPADRWTTLVDEALRRSMPDSGPVVSVNLGVNGDTTRNGLERLKDVYAFHPDIVTIQFGMNDCNYWQTDNGLPRVNPVSFEHNLREMVDKLRGGGVREIILSTNHLIPVSKPMLNGCDYNTNNGAYNAIVRRVAVQAAIPLCDIECAFEIASRDKAMFLDESGRWVHLSRQGNSIYADAILPLIEQAVQRVRS